MSAGASKGGSLDTLAQPDRNAGSAEGPTSGDTARAKLVKRARAMTFSKALATQLAEAAKVAGSPLEQSYRNTIYCNSSLDQEGGLLTGKYCGNRWCATCARIRTALAMEKYLPVVRGWNDVQFVTLTLRNVPADQLEATIDRMLQAFTAIKRGIKGTDRVPFKAIRKLECTYNAQTDEYHPHFHLHVEGREAAALLMQRWLDYFPDETDPAAQDIRPAGDDASLRELFKYFTKLITKRTVISAVPLDVIFRAMQGHRVYQPVGFVLPKEAADDEGELALDHGTEAITRRGESIVWEWNQQATDWVDRDTGECLTGYEPTARFRQLLEQIEHPPSLPTVRTLNPVEPVNVNKIRDALRRHQLATAPYAPEFVSQTLQRVFALSAKRARALAARAMADDVQSQLAFSYATDRTPR